MKVDNENLAFRPIHITIENKHDYDCVRACLQHYLDDYNNPTLKKLFDDIKEKQK